MDSSTDSITCELCDLEKIIYLFCVSVHLKMRSSDDKPKLYRMKTFYKMTGQYFPKESRSRKETKRKQD